MIQAANLFLMLFGPFLVVGLVAAVAALAWPGFLEVLFPPARPAPRPVTRPGPARWAVA